MASLDASFSASSPPDTQNSGPRLDLATAVETDADGNHALNLLIGNVHCGGCVRKIEDKLAADPSVETARLNLSTRRLTLRWTGEARLANQFATAVEDLGYPVALYRMEAVLERDKKTDRALIMALAVSFFGAANVMMLAWAVWAGHFATMGQGTRDFFHWIAALIAVPCVYYAGQPFFQSAIAACARARPTWTCPSRSGSRSPH